MTDQPLTQSSSSTLQDLQKLAGEDMGKGDDQRLRVVLSRLALEINARLQDGSPASAEYMNSAIAALKKLPGFIHADLRGNCLIDAAHYFYVVGQSFNAIDP